MRCHTTPFRSTTRGDAFSVLGGRGICRRSAVPRPRTRPRPFRCAPTPRSLLAVMGTACTPACAPLSCRFDPVGQHSSPAGYLTPYRVRGGASSAMDGLRRRGRQVRAASTSNDSVLRAARALPKPPRTVGWLPPVGTGTPYAGCASSLTGPSERNLRLRWRQSRGHGPVTLGTWRSSR